MKSRLLAGAAAAMLAIVGALLVMSYARNADQRAMKDLDPVPVVVVQAAIPAGTPVESMAKSLTTKNLPAASVSASAVSSLEDSTGKVAAVDLVPGEQLVAERLVAPEKLKSRGAVEVPPGLQEVSFQLAPNRVVGGRLAPGDRVGVFVSLDSGGSESDPATETTKLTVRKVLVTAVQSAPDGTTAPAEGSDPSAPDPRDTTLPTGSLMLTVAVNDIDAAKIVFAGEFGTVWLSKEPLDATESGPRIIQRNDIYK